MTHARIAVLGLLLALVGCAAEDKPSAWEILQGTAHLTASMSLDPNTNATLGNFPTRTGELVVADDSTVTGWIKLAAGDTAHVTGVVTRDGGLLMTLTGLDPAEYEVLTNGDFPDNYALLSTASVTGGDAPGLHKVYWEFAR